LGRLDQPLHAARIGGFLVLLLSLRAQGDGGGVEPQRRENEVHLWLPLWEVVNVKGSFGRYWCLIVGCSLTPWSSATCELGVQKERFSTMSTKMLRTYQEDHHVLLSAFAPRWPRGFVSVSIVQLAHCHRSTAHCVYSSAEKGNTPWMSLTELRPVHPSNSTSSC